MAYRAAKKDLDRAHLIICEKPLKASVDSKKQQNPKSGSFANAESFEKDYPTFLLSLASSLRTGLDPLAALLEVRKLFDTKSVIRAELEKFRGLIEGGMDETEAFIPACSNLQSLSYNALKPPGADSYSTYRIVYPGL